MTSPLARKLGIKPGMTVTLIAAPDSVADLLLPVPDGSELREVAEGGASDALLLFAQDSASLDRLLAGGVEALKPGGLLWIAYLKGGKKAGTDLNRDLLRQQLEARGLAGVTLVSVDDRWSAMRFRPAAEVGR
jgi:hypothetical protein